MVIHAYYDLSHVSKENMRGAYAEHRVSVIDTCEELAILLDVKLFQDEIENAKKKLEMKGCR
jgi:hypothetical protein